MREGTVAVVLRNGRVAQIIGPGRQLMFRLPFQKVETFLIDTKIRNLNIGGPKQGVVFPLRSPAVTVGRAGDNDIVLQDTTVSGRHARIERQGDQAVIVDLNSSNGTFVNGQRITQTLLNGGETILMGDTHLRFEAL